MLQMLSVVGLERNMSASKLAGSVGSNLNVDLQPSPSSRYESQSMFLYRYDALNCTTVTLRGHGGRVVTLSPPTSAAGVGSPSWP